MRVRVGVSGLRRLAALGLALVVVACTSAPAQRAPTAAAPPGATSAPAAAATPAPAPSPAAEPPTRIRFPYTAVSVVILPLWVAYDGGYFTQENLQADLEFISTGPTLTQAMLAGEVPIAFSGLEAAVSATLAGADVVVLGAGTDRFLFRIYGVPGVASFGDLRGKRVGVTRLGTATDVLARMMLQRNGLEPDRDTAIVQVGGLPEILAAMQAGAIDGGVLSPPTMFGAEAAGYQRLVDTTEVDIPFHQAVVVSTRRQVAEQPETTRRALRAYLRGVARLKQDRAFAKQVLAAWTKTEDEAVLEQSWVLLDRILQRTPYPQAEAIQIALDAARAQNPGAPVRPPTDFYDDRPLRELENSGFVAELYR